jgi:EpsI family protein
MFRRTLILVACLLVSAGLMQRANRPEPAPARETLDGFPMRLDDWQGVQQPPFAKDILAVLGVDDYLTRAYFTADRKAGVGLYIGYYSSQRQGDTMHSPLNCLPGAGWEPVSKSTVLVNVNDATTGGTRDIEINRYMIQKGLEKQLVLYWYQAHNRVVASEYWGKFYLVADAVRLNRTDGSLVRVIVPVNSDERSEGLGEANAIKFVKAMFPVLPRFLPV